MKSTLTRNYLSAKNKSKSSVNLIEPIKNKLNYPHSTLNEKELSYENTENSITSNRMKNELTTLQDKINTLEEKLQTHHTERMYRENSFIKLCSTTRENTHPPEISQIITKGAPKLHEIRRKTVVQNTSRPKNNREIPKSMIMFSDQKNKTYSFVQNPVILEKNFKKKKSKKCEPIAENIDELKKELKKWKSRYLSVKTQSDTLKKDFNDLVENYRVSEELRKKQQNLISDLENQLIYMKNKKHAKKKPIKHNKENTII